MTTDDYRNSWAWVHYLVHHSEQSKKLFQQYLSAISAGEAPGQFTEFAQQRAPGVTNGLGSYFRRFRISLR